MKNVVLPLDTSFLNRKVIFALKNNSVVFFVFLNVDTKIYFSFSFQIHSFFSLLFRNNYLFFIDKYSNRQFLKTIINTISKCFISLFFETKTRIRMSGLGYSLDAIENYVTLNVGYTIPPEINIPSSVLQIRTNRKKKKVLLYGTFLYQVKNFAAYLRNFRHVNVYNRKGIRFRFERVRLKKGKRESKH